MSEQKIFTPEQKQKLKVIAEHYGMKHQIHKLCEESAELIAAHIRWQLYEEKPKGAVGQVGLINNFVEELADVFVVLHEIKILLMQNPQALFDVQQAAGKKIDRQIQRIEAEKNES